MRFAGHQRDVGVVRMIAVSAASTARVEDEPRERPINPGTFSTHALKNLMKSKDRQDTNDTDADSPSDGVRSIITLLLILHLFCVGVALSANWERSLLKDALKQVLAPYIRTLALDPEDRPYELTHAEAVDVDNSIRVRITDPIGDIWQMQLPDPERWPSSASYRRGRSLADALAFGALSENERADSMVAQIAQGVAAHAVANWRRERDELSADTPIRAEIICRQHTLQSIDNARSGTPRQRNPHDPAFFRNIYEADILVDTRTGSVELNRRRQAGQVAPIEIDNNRPAAGTQNTTSGFDVGGGKGLITTN